MSEEKAQEKPFKVDDRRRFSDTGELKREFKKEEDSPVKEQAVGGNSREKSREPLPEISFSTFVMGLSTQALMHLGEIPNPSSEKVVLDFEGARQMIDILAILQKKTEGNLDSNEKALMDTVLYDLRMRYIERATKKS